jgi:hypothetical protein
VSGVGSVYGGGGSGEVGAFLFFGFLQSASRITGLPWAIRLWVAPRFWDSTRSRPASPRGYLFRFLLSYPTGRVCACLCLCSRTPRPMRRLRLRLLCRGMGIGMGMVERWVRFSPCLCLCLLVFARAGRAVGHGCPAMCPLLGSSLDRAFGLAEGLRSPTLCGGGGGDGFVGRVGLLWRGIIRSRVELAV